jgi:acyl carrier protein
MGEADRGELIKALEALDLYEFDAATLKDDVPLTEQGLDSLDMMNLYFQIEEQFQLKISEESLEKNEWNTINKILSKINMIK